MTPHTRRSFLKRCGRIALSGVLGYIAIRLGLGARLYRRGETCINDSICTRCSELERCVLPTAQSVRAFRGRKG